MKSNISAALILSHLLVPDKNIYKNQIFGVFCQEYTSRIGKGSIIL